MTEPVDDPDVHQDEEEDPWAPEPTEVVDPFSPGFFFADRFRIEAPLGVGAMGAVYRATDPPAASPMTAVASASAQRSLPTPPGPSKR